MAARNAEKICVNARRNKQLKIQFIFFSRPGGQTGGQPSQPGGQFL